MHPSARGLSVNCKAKYLADALMRRSWGSRNVLTCDCTADSIRLSVTQMPSHHRSDTVFGVINTSIARDRWTFAAAVIHSNVPAAGLVKVALLGIRSRPHRVSGIVGRRFRWRVRSVGAKQALKHVAAARMDS